MTDLRLGDGMAEMAAMPDGAVDHVIADPPFSEKTHAGARSVVDLGSRLVTFPPFDDAAYLGFAAESVRVAKRWVVMFCDWRHAALLETAGLPLVRLGVWIKPNGAPQFSGDRPGTGWEPIAILHRPGRKRWNGGGRHGVWTCSRVHKNVHPTQKPVKLLSQFLADFTDPGDLVLDPFAGSGSTGVACAETGRAFVGVECDPGHFATARARIEAAELAHTGAVA